MRKWLVILLIFTLFTHGGSVREREVRAVAVVALAPEAVVLLLVAAGGLVTLAYQIGRIDEATRDRHQRNLQSAIDSIHEATEKGLSAGVEAAKKAVALMVVIQSGIGLKLVCDEVVAKAFRRESSSSSSTKTLEARRASAGECEPDLRGDPFKCCPKFMGKFKTGAQMTSVGRGSFKVSYWGRHAIQKQCCFEWDSLHGRFEVYSESNHGPKKHHGEKACATDESLSEDLCTANIPEKADFLSRRHAPRNGC